VQWIIHEKVIGNRGAQITRTHHNSTPGFSIVVPAYNASAVIEETIVSLLNQSFQDYEIIIVDDGSADNTQEVLGKYAEKLQILRQVNQGPEVARNLGIQHAKGEYIVSFDSDDILCPHALEVYHETIQYFKNPPLILSRMEYFTANEEKSPLGWDGKRIECTEAENFFKKKLSIAVSNSNIIARRDTLLKVGGYQLNTFIVDDRALLFRLGMESPMIAITSPITVRHRSHPNNSSKNTGLVTKGTLALIAYERKNVYPGGDQMRFDRRGLVGSYLFKTFRSYLGIKNIRQILAIILKARTMLITGIARKILSSNYYSKNHLIEIKKEAAR
jgi:glycosyltransferase involved in cell wall biosynthesis